MAIILLALGAIFLLYLFAVVRQWRTSHELIIEAPENSVVPVSLIDSEDAVIVAEGHGRLVYANTHARDWFDLDGNAPNMTLMAQKTHPPDTFRDIFAQEGKVGFRIGNRHVEATSHAIPSNE